jgi:hypothetical protein
MATDAPADAEADDSASDEAIIADARGLPEFCNTVDGDNCTAALR